MGNKFFRDFISNEERTFKFKIGKVVASSLAGFVIGAISATIVLVTAYIVFANGDSIF